MRSILRPYRPRALREGRGGCECHAPQAAREVAERIAPRFASRFARARGLRENAAPHVPRDVEPVVLAGGPGSKCRPFLTVHKDAERFAACNALADEIGPIVDPKQAVKLLREVVGDEVNEVFGIVTLDLHLRLKSVAETGRGEPSSVMAPLVPTLQAALIDGAHAVIIFHCHPSGVEAEPSDADKETTEAFVDAFDTVGVILMDHIIIGGDARKKSYFSFAEDGLLD